MLMIAATTSGLLCCGSNNALGGAEAGRWQAPALPCTLAVSNVTPRSLPDYLDPFTHPSPSGSWSDFPVSSVVIDGEVWIIYKNGYREPVIRYKGTNILNAARQPDGKLNPTHPTYGTVVHPYMLGGMWYDPTEKKLYAPMHCEYAPPTQGEGIVLRQVHLATSTDRGLSWSYEGPLLTGDTSVAPFANAGSYWNGGDGDFYLYVDERGGYFYLFTTFYLWPKTDVNVPYFMRHRVARCRISDKMASGTWRRYYDGGWNEPGIGGRASYVDAHRVIYCRALQKYIGFNYGTGVAVCSDLGRQDWSPSFKLPGNCWGTPQNLELTPMAEDGVSTWEFERTLTLYTYLQGWKAGPAHVYRLEFAPGAMPNPEGYLGWGTGVETKKFFDPDWDGPATLDPLRPYGPPSYDLDDPIERRRVRRVNAGSPEIVYTGAWVPQAAPVASQVSANAGDRLSFTFHGTGIFWRAQQASDCGRADVFLDGTWQKTVDCFGKYTPYKVWFARTDLDPRVEHKLQIVVRGEKSAPAQGAAIKHISFECAGDSNQASDGFSSVNGKHDWQYLSRDGTTEAGMAFQGNRWASAQPVVVGPDYLQPAVGHDAIRRWVAPHAGTVRIEGAVSFVGAPAAGAWSASIGKGNATLWFRKSSTPGDAGAVHDLTVEVAAGDDISFQARLETAPPESLPAGLGRLANTGAVERGAAQPADTNGTSSRLGNRVQWDPVITYLMR
jgi:hypothetical protein